MIVRVPNAKPSGDNEAYRTLAEALNQNTAETQPFHVRNVSSDFTVSADYGTYLVDTVSHGATLTAMMPLAGAHKSRQFVIKKLDGGHHIHINPTGSDTIELSAGITLTSTGESKRLVSDGVSNWAVIGG